jgi:hypothetical protein
MTHRRSLRKCVGSIRSTCSRISTTGDADGLATHASTARGGDTPGHGPRRATRRSRARTRRRDSGACGFRTCGITFGRRLRAAGVSLEDRKALLGHKDREITTHYSAPEIGCLIGAANRIQRSHLVHTPTARVVMDHHGLGRSSEQQEFAR